MVLQLLQTNYFNPRYGLKIQNTQDFHYVPRYNFDATIAQLRGRPWCVAASKLERRAL